MIVTGGTARGRKISSPEGLLIRPTASKMRQAFFNILQSRVDGASFLDVFAGTGLMGIEALSRGASSLVSVEESSKAARAIERNLQHLNFTGVVMVGDFRQLLPELKGEKFDIVFADPPYKSTFAASVVRLVETLDLLEPEGVLVVEHAKSAKIDRELKKLYIYDVREYGQSALSFFARRQDD